VRLSYHKLKLKLHELFCDHDTVVTFSVVKNNLTGKIIVPVILVTLTSFFEQSSMECR